ncbi:hypothetical protein CK516_01160 [Nostoc sp. 'Peltigera malacea cyanobiont' DB3992]|nr:hypothetical protein CK516_01160 [Nostoc sp. 'Peltigera malacea cyanobiont' DB3992]
MGKKLGTSCLDSFKFYIRKRTAKYWLWAQREERRKRYIIFTNDLGLLYCRLVVTKISKPKMIAVA